MRAPNSLLSLLVPLGVLAVSLLAPGSALAQCGDRCAVDDEGNFYCTYSILAVTCTFDDYDCENTRCVFPGSASAITPARGSAFSQCAMSPLPSLLGDDHESSRQVKAVLLKART
jgi:hypothetical protein